MTPLRSDSIADPQNRKVAVRDLLGIGFALTILLPYWPWDIGPIGFNYMRAMMLWFAALFMLAAWLVDKRPQIPLPRIAKMGLIVFTYALVSNLLLSGDFSKALFAPDYAWYGVLSMAAGLTIALVGSRYIRLNYLRLYYAITFWAGIVGFVLVFCLQPTIGRFAGMVRQPNLQAVLLGAAVIIGIVLKDRIVTDPRRRLVMQALMLSVIISTGTRAVLYVVLAYWLYDLWQRRGHTYKLWPVWIGLAAASILLAGLIVAPRTLKIDRLSYGVGYRSDLIVYSYRHTGVMPPWGFGPGLAEPLSSGYVPLPSSLQASADQDFKVPESSHNVLMDRLLEYGWLAGISYLALVGMALAQGFRARKLSEYHGLVFVMLVYLLIQELVTVPRYEIDILLWIVMIIAIQGKDWRLLEEK